MKIDANLVKKVSSKGNEYYVIVVKIAEGVEKYVFLNSAELKLLELLHK